jgi:hypothetical protein
MDNDRRTIIDISGNSSQKFPDESAILIRQDASPEFNYR